jgi:sugar lactone lactonase YvrE
MFGGMAFDNSGNLYLSDWGNYRVRKVDTNGIITTVAGNGAGGYSGDGGPATNASLLGNSGVAVDSSGNIYIADGSNNRVRKVDTNGIITTVAGNGTGGDSGDGTAATNAELWGASGVCLDSAGNLYIADYRNNSVREVTNGIIKTVAGLGGAGFSGDGYPARMASLKWPFAVALDRTGNLYIADSGNGRVRKVNASGIITTVAGNGTCTYPGDGGAATNAGLCGAQSVVMDGNGNMFIADFEGSCIREVSTNGVITTVAGNGTPTYSGDGGAATNAGISQPSGVALDAAGNLFINAQSGVREVLLAGSPTWALNHVSTNAAGDYSVIVTSPGGSVTSIVATLTVQVRPDISGVTPQLDGSVAISFSGTPNTTNSLWSTVSLLAPVAWSLVSTGVTSADGTGRFIDSAATGCPARFYRVAMP